MILGSYQGNRYNEQLQQTVAIITIHGKNIADIVKRLLSNLDVIED